MFLPKRPEATAINVDVNGIYELLSLSRQIPGRCVRQSATAAFPVFPTCSVA
jgi:hypothetical protein